MKKLYITFSFDFNNDLYPHSATFRIKVLDERKAWFNSVIWHRPLARPRLYYWMEQPLISAQTQRALYKSITLINGKNNWFNCFTFL